MSNDSLFIKTLRSHVSARAYEEIISALQVDLASDRSDSVRSVPTISAKLEAVSNDGRSDAQRIMLRAAARFNVEPKDSKLNVWEIRASKRFATLTPEQKITELEKLRLAGRLRTADEA
jgi:hypothetical protein